MIFKRMTTLLLMIMILCLSTIFAQGQMQAPPDPETQKLYQEYNQLSQQLQQLQQQAMTEEKIAQKGEALDKKITEAMIANNPDIKTTLDQRDEIITQFQSVQESGDQQKLMQLNQQYQAISQKIQTEQQKVMQNPELQTEMQAFESMVMAKMTEINPNTPQLMNQLQTLRDQLISKQQGQN